ncbi:hypothetical protein ABEW34_29955 [Paenibacillus algorifonticola]|uniref:hypothetical protein n=1 Tax=Paenibacillus algorifonticola TaxID=684063 RepID=UPI003D26EF63
MENDQKIIELKGEWGFYPEQLWGAWQKRRQARYPNRRMFLEIGAVCSWICTIVKLSDMAPKSI